MSFPAASVLLRSSLSGLLLALAAAVPAQSANPTSPSAPVVRVRPNPFPQLLEGPAAPEQREAWLEAMLRWREEPRKLISTALQPLPDPYTSPKLQWTRHNFVHVLTMAHERYLYDPEQRRYTVDRYLDDLEGRYGGVDSVLLWPTYPNLGVDNRNQYDMWRDMPGGLDGVRQMLADFRRRGVRTILPIMVWDTGTRDEGAPMAQALVRLASEVGFDGLFGDTMRGVSRDYAEEAARIGHPLALEPELDLDTTAALAWNSMSWGYWWPYPAAPGVALYKWIEPRHMIHVTDRWAHDRTDMLQYAFFNGVGYTSWENVFGVWMRITPRDGEALRRIAAIYRAFPELITGGGFEPYVPVEQPGVFASRFPGEKQTLWTLVNRTDQPVEKPILNVFAKTGMRFFDLWNGVELAVSQTGTTATLHLPLDPRGYGALLACEEGATAAVEKFLGNQRKRRLMRLSDLSSTWSVLTQQMTEIPPTAPAAQAPPGMIRVPGGKFLYEVDSVLVEQHEGAGVQFPWEEKPELKHRREMEMKTFFIDRHPVTCGEFQRFLEATGYRPADSHNFLRGWTNGRPPAGWEKKPVTWVSLEDARAYARWSGKRLPHDWEWQYAAQGSDRRLYPWGNTDETTRTPALHKGREQPPPADVDAHPQGASALGVMDLVGNVWQWTDEFSDEHTRAALVRGGSGYTPSGSSWYFPQARELNKHGKYLLMAPSLDRSATIGFRCVKDATE